MATSSYAFVTLLTSDPYLPGALALAAALKDLHPSPPSPPQVPFATVCLVTPESVDVSSIKLLRSAFDLVVGVELITQQDQVGLKLLGRLDLNAVLTKLHVFRLTQFSKIIFLDADVLPVRPLSHLFTIPHEFSAVPDVGWPDIFNSGVMVLTPGEDKFSELSHLLESKGSWDGGDQGLLNEWRAGDWNRLSFIYNTTPTAAYTYAPAYERFGSQISAVHFIGPNKPWNDISYRIPSSSHPATDSPQQAYDYNTLVDRWYDVYDKHYRIQDIPPQTQFEVTPYAPAWSGTPASVQPSSSAPPTTRILSLDELKRLAIEGINASSYPSHSENFQFPSSGRGEYRSMPLDGRVDLMRPKMQKEEDQEYHANVEDKRMPQTLQTLSGDDAPLTPLAGQSLAPLAGQSLAPSTGQSLTPLAGRTNLPPSTPELYQVPPSPRPHTITLPPITPTHQSVAPLAGQSLAASAEQSLTPLAGRTNLPPSTPGLYQVPPSPRPHTITLPPITPTHRSVGPHHFRTSKPQSPSTSGHALHRSPEKAQEYNHLPHRHTHPQKEPHFSVEKHSAPPRPRSPTMLIWNPAVEPPPTSLPPASAFPSDTYFPNLWDPSTYKKSGQSHPPKSLFPDSAALFEPLPPPEIPESLVQQGHYRNVTGEDELGAIPSPDRTKVKHVFPWEEKPRHLPGRVFPAVDSPKPSLFLSPESQTSSSEMPTTPETKSSHLLPALSPLSGFPADFNYTNAWDTIPSIQKYAEKLAQPPTPKTLAPAFEDKNWNKRGRSSWEERTEVSSRDGDVEDEGDDTADERPHDSSPDDDKGIDSSASGRRRSKHAPPVERNIKQYREIGVQTDPREVRTQAVQTSPLGEKSPERSPGKVRRPTMSGRRWWTPSSRHDVPPLVTTQDFDITPNRPQSAGTASLDTPLRGEKQPLHPSPLRSPIAALPSPRKLHSTDLAGPKSTSLRPPHAIPSSPAISSQTSNSSSLGSPISPIDPHSPSESQPNSPRPRKAGRVWDPARGVELFKRGSEEVLARFLRMGSREDGHR